MTRSRSSSAVKVHALVADMETVLLLGARNTGNGLQGLSKPLTVEPIGIAVPPGDALMMNFLQNTLGALEASGVMNQIMGRWFESNAWLENLP